MDFLSRAGLDEEKLKGLIERTADFYNVGSVHSFNVIETGFEDLNIFLQTDTGKYVVKIFSINRSKNEIDRNTNILEAVSLSNIRHPKIHKGANGSLVYVDDFLGNKLVLMGYVEGKSFVDIDKWPTSSEVADLVDQIFQIHSLKIKPEYIDDSWCVLSIEGKFNLIKGFLNDLDKEMLQKVVDNFKKIQITKLPTSFVHGDLTKSNVIKGIDSNCYLIDFSVSNIYPRIQDLAVVAANFMHEKDGAYSLSDRVNILINEYSKYSELTEYEREVLYTYSLACVAMEFVGACQEKFLKGNFSLEMEYWLSLGREGLLAESSLSR